MKGQIVADWTGLPNRSTIAYTSKICGGRNALDCTSLRTGQIFNLTHSHEIWLGLLGNSVNKGDSQSE